MIDILSDWFYNENTNLTETLIVRCRNDRISDCWHIVTTIRTMVFRKCLAIHAKELGY